MYERMLNKQVVPTVEAMTEYCAENAERFSILNDWLTTTFHTSFSLPPLLSDEADYLTISKSNYQGGNKCR